MKNTQWYVWNPEPLPQLWLLLIGIQTYPSSHSQNSNPCSFSFCFAFFPRTQSSWMILIRASSHTDPLRSPPAGFCTHIPLKCSGEGLLATSCQQIKWFLICIALLFLWRVALIVLFCSSLCILAPGHQGSPFLSTPGLPHFSWPCQAAL